MRHIVTVRHDCTLKMHAATVSGCMRRVGAMHMRDHRRRTACLLRPLLTGPAGQAPSRTCPGPQASLLCLPSIAYTVAPRPAAACRAALFLSLRCLRLGMLSAALLLWLTEALSQLQGWPGRLLVCERSSGPHMHGS
jgi:hypothetical protein